MIDDNGSPEVRIEFPAAYKEAAEARLTKLRKAALKCGMPAPLYVISEPIKVWRHVAPGKEAEVLVRVLTLAQIEVKLPGEWTLVGTIHPTDAGNILGAAPGQVIPGEYRAKDGRWCDHCRTRRARNETHIVRSATGEHKQVGSACIKDFLGGDTAERAAQSISWLGMLTDFVEEAERGFGGHHTILDPLLETLTLTAYFIRVIGWVSASEARYAPESAPLTATASQVSWWRHPGSPAAIKELREFKETHGEPTEADADVARATIAWAEGWSEERLAKSDYLANLAVVVKLGAVDPKFHSLACSLVASYLKEQDRLTKAERKRASAHVGAEGERREFSGLRVDSVWAQESQYGTTERIEFSDPDGNVLMWWASRAGQVVRGDIVSGKATIKRHAVYNSIKQTVLSRFTISSTTAAATDNGNAQ